MWSKCWSVKTVVSGGEFYSEQVVYRTEWWRWDRLWTHCVQYSTVQQCRRLGTQHQRYTQTAVPPTLSHCLLRSRLLTADNSASARWSFITWEEISPDATVCLFWPWFVLWRHRVTLNVFETIFQKKSYLYFVMV